jgi:HEAT repeat protein
MHADSDTIVDALVKQLSEPSVQRRRDASEELFRLGKEASAAIPALLLATKDEDNAVRFMAVAALGSSGAGGPEVIKGLTDVLIAPSSFPTLKALAAVKLGRIGPAAEPCLIQLLDHPDEIIRTHVAEALCDGDFDRTVIIPRLLRLLDDSSGDVRWSAARILAKIGLQAVPYLEEVIGKNSGDAVCHAARAILTNRPDHEPAMRALVTQLDNPDPTVRRHAAWFLQDAGPHGGPAVQRLIEALGDDDPKVRSFASWSLGDIGLPSKRAELAIVEALHDDDWAVRTSAAYALGEIRAASPAAIDGLARAVDDQFRDVQVASVLALEKIGALARAAAPSLRRALIRAADDPDMQARITESLQSIATA